MLSRQILLMVVAVTVARIVRVAYDHTHRRLPQVDSHACGSGSYFSPSFSPLVAVTTEFLHHECVPGAPWCALWTQGFAWVRTCE